jgi:6-phosphogluconolactonase (cycloisomerase 2 family)
MSPTSVRPFALTALFLAAALPAPAQISGPGVVYTMTNATAGNRVAVAFRAGERLLPIASFATGGAGTSAGLGSQSAIALSGDGRWLFATNPGSDELTLFRVLFGVLLWRTDVVPSGGDMPTSVAVHDDLVYVLNAGEQNGIAGFRRVGGELHALAGAVYPLSQAGAMPAQVGFDPRGDWVVVTERATNRILTFGVNGDGTLRMPVTNASSGQTPFGFLFRRDGLLVVSEAFGGMPGASAMASYRLGMDGRLQTVTGSLGTSQTAACWVAIPPSGSHAYTTNTGSGSITGYALADSGQLTRLDPTGRTGVLDKGAGPIDFDFDRSGRLLFVLDSTGHEVVGFRRNRDGSLARLPVSWSVPAGSAGLLAR